jgi:hypothetical protein
VRGNLKRITLYIMTIACMHTLRQPHTSLSRSYDLSLSRSCSPSLSRARALCINTCICIQTYHGVLPLSRASELILIVCPACRIYVHMSVFVYTYIRLYVCISAHIHTSYVILKVRPSCRMFVCVTHTHVFIVSMCVSDTRLYMCLVCMYNRGGERVG